MPGYAEENPTYYPALRLITSITQDNPAEITTSFNHGYSSGLIVRIKIPSLYGMEQLANFVGVITVTGDTTFTIDKDTTNFTPFAAVSPEPWYQNTYAEVVPLGEVNNTLYQATRNIL